MTKTMSPKRRWLAVLDGEQPDRIPTDYWATPEFHKKLVAHVACDGEALHQKLHIDVPLAVGPSSKMERHPDDPEANIWGVRSTPVDYGTGVYHEVAHHPLGKAETAEHVHAFRWPSPDDLDYDVVSESVRDNPHDRPVKGGIFEPFLIYCAMRGMERAFEDLIVAPDIADAMFTHLFDYHYEMNRRIFEAADGGIDFTYVAEDLGSQTGPLFGLEHYRRHLLPNQKKMADLARSHGVHVFYHTDGAARVFLPDLIDIVGIEVLNPIQWRCRGMEREGLVRDFGDRIAFHGAMDNQQTLPFGSVGDVIAEVKQNIELFRQARWFCAPCHNIQAVSPPENIVAMYETIHEFGTI